MCSTSPGVLGEPRVSPPQFPSTAGTVSEPGGKSALSQHVPGMDSACLVLLWKVCEEMSEGVKEREREREEKAAARERGELC